MKPIALILMISFLMVGCAHVPKDMTPTQEEGRSLAELTEEERAEDFRKIEEFIEIVLAITIFGGIITLCIVTGTVLYW